VAAEADSPRRRSPRCAMTGPRIRFAGQGASWAPQGKRKPWRARIWIDGKDVQIGYFATKAEAHAAYAAAAKQFGLKLKGR
jgi:hypothetical protein